MDNYISIKGVQEAQRDNLRMIRALEPDSALDKGAEVAALYMHRRAVVETHVDTGALRASHRVYKDAAAEYRISIDENSVGFKRTFSGGHARRAVSFLKTPPSEYGVYEHARGGSHAFYEIAYDEFGDIALEMAYSTIVRGLDG